MPVTIRPAMKVIGSRSQTNKSRTFLNSVYQDAAEFKTQEIQTSSKRTHLPGLLNMVSLQSPVQNAPDWDTLTGTLIVRC